VRHSADEMQAVTETDPDLAPLERLSAGLDRYLEYVDTHARGYSTVLRAGIGSDREVAAIVEDVRSAMANRILDDFPGEAPPPPGVRIAVRGWVGFAEAASLEWLGAGRSARRAARPHSSGATGAVGARLHCFDGVAGRSPLAVLRSAYSITEEAAPAAARPGPESQQRWSLLFSCNSNRPRPKRPGRARRGPLSSVML
jgi:hypothetical protein